MLGDCKYDKTTGIKIIREYWYLGIKENKLALLQEHMPILAVFETAKQNQYKITT